MKAAGQRDKILRLGLSLTVISIHIALEKTPGSNGRLITALASHRPASLPEMAKEVHRASVNVSSSQLAGSTPETSPPHRSTRTI
jgi:hypothetical protein